MELVLRNLKIFFEDKVAYLKSLGLIQSCFFISSIFELSGILMLGPLIYVSTGPNEALANPYINYFYELLNLVEPSTLVLIIFCLTISLIIIGGIFSVLSVVLMSKMATESGVILGNKLLKGYIYDTWTNFLKDSDNKIINEVYQESSRVTQNILVPLLMVNKGLILVIFIVFGLCFVDIVFTAFFFCLLVFTYLIIYLFFRTRLYNNSEKLTGAHENRLSYLSDIFKLFREIKLWRAHKDFLKGFNNESRKWAAVYRENLNIALLPRYIVEVILLVLSCIAIVITFYSSNDLSQAIPKFSIYAFSAFKLLPAIQTIYYSSSQIRGNIYSLEAILRALNSFPNNITNPSDGLDKVNKISFKGINFSYDNHANIIKENSFSAKLGDLIGISGPSGAGKSTFLDILLGLLKPDSGKILLNDHEFIIYENPNWFSRVSYSSPKTFLFKNTIKNNIFFSIDQFENENINQIGINLDFLAAKNEKDIYTEDDFSEGQLQRIGLARAIIKGNAEVFIFDEPTSALDNINTRQIISRFKELAKNSIVFIVTHDLELLKQMNKILIFDDGRLSEYQDYKDAISSSGALIELLNEN